MPRPICCSRARYDAACCPMSMNPLRRISGSVSKAQCAGNVGASAAANQRMGSECFGVPDQVDRYRTCNFRVAQPRQERIRVRCRPRAPSGSTTTRIKSPAVAASVHLFGRSLPKVFPRPSATHWGEQSVRWVGMTIPDGSERTQGLVVRRRWVSWRVAASTRRV